MKNKLIRNALSATNMKQWQLGALMGVSEATIYRMLREELPEDKQKEIVERIRKAVQ